MADSRALMRSARRLLAMLTLLLAWLINVTPVAPAVAMEGTSSLPGYVYDSGYTPTETQAVTSERGPPAPAGKRSGNQSVRLETLGPANVYEPHSRVYDLKRTLASRDMPLPVGVLASQARISESTSLRPPSAGTGAAAKGTIAVDASIGRAISAQRQARHVLGSDLYNGGGYFKDAADAQRVLDAYHAGDTVILRTTSNGNVIVRYDGVTGFNNNPGAGYLDQPTDVFMIKGTSSVSIVPYSPGG